VESRTPQKPKRSKSQLNHSQLLHICGSAGIILWLAGQGVGMLWGMGIWGVRVAPARRIKGDAVKNVALGVKEARSHVHYILKELAK